MTGTEQAPTLPRLKPAVPFKVDGRLLAVARRQDGGELRITTFREHGQRIRLRNWPRRPDDLGWLQGAPITFLPADLPGLIAALQAAHAELASITPSNTTPGRAGATKELH